MAGGSFLVFIDADIIVKKDTFSRIAKTFSTHPHLDAIVGLYSPEHENPDLLSQYKNLYTYYEYSTAPESIPWFFTSIGAVKRAAFEQAGGFDTSLSSASGLDDIEFGRRLTAQGHNILLDKGLAVYHLKGFTPGSFLKNEWQRSHAWIRFVLSPSPEEGTVTKKERLAQAPLSFLGGIFSLFLGTLFLMAAPFRPLYLLGTLVCIATFFMINFAFLRILKKYLPTRWAPAALLLLLDQFLMGLGGVTGLLSLAYQKGRKGT